MKRIFNLISLVIIMAGLMGVPQSTVSAKANFFVSPDGSGTACIESDPCSLQQAASAIVGFSNIYMEEGTYTVASGKAVAAFTESVWIFGSCVFDGNDATPPNCGYQDSHRSIINGQFARRGLELSGNETSLKNFSVLYVDIINGKGFADIGQCTDAFGDPGGCGGGMHISYGGIVYLYSMNFNNNYGSQNPDHPAGYGGGVYVQNSTKLIIDHCRFTGNRANATLNGFGGGVFAINIGSDIVSIENSEFDSNYCSGGIDAISSRGCGVMVYNSDDVIIEENVFNLNNPFGISGIKGVAVNVDDNHSFEIHENIFTLNSWGNSVVGADNSTNTYPSVIDANYFRDNSSYSLIEHEGRYWVKITNNFLIHDNPYTTSSRGGPTYSSIKLTSNYGSPVKSIANIYHNSVSGGTYGLNIGENLMTIIKNNIIAYTDNKAIVVPAAPVNFVGDYQTNLFWLNLGGIGITDPTTITDPPEFIDPVADLHIYSNSPAIDAGTSDLGVHTDFDGQSRPVGGYDIGADEFMWTSFMPMILR